MCRISVFCKLSSIKRALIKFGFNVICVFTSVDQSRKRGVVSAGYVLRVHVAATERVAKKSLMTQIRVPSKHFACV